MKNICGFKVLLSLLALMVSFSLLGQADILTKKGKKYYYKGEDYKCKELGPIYEQVPEAIQKYESGLSHKKTARILTFAGLGLIGAGIAIPFFSHSFGPLVIGGLSIMGGITVQIVAIFPRIRGGNQIRKAKDIFNFEMIKRHGYDNRSSLSLNSTSNGIGLVLTF